MKQLLLSVLFVGSLIAANHPCPNHWQESIEFLYLLPTVDDTYYVLQSSESLDYPNGTRENNSFSFEPGYRVGVEYSFCDPQREFRAFYTYLSTTQTNSVAGQHLWTTLGSPAFGDLFEDYVGWASASSNLFYQRLEFSYAQRILDATGLYFYIEPGIELAYVRLTQSYTYRESGIYVGMLEERSKIEGVGPQLGLELGYDFYTIAPPCGTTHTFSTTGLFAGAILSSWSQAGNSSTLTGSGTVLDTEDRAVWRVIPALHAQAGLNYAAHFRTAGVALGLGYEFSTYIRGVSKALFSDKTTMAGDAVSSLSYDNFDLQGLYISGAVTF